jgi:methylmalonyl-CoA mutase
MSQPMSQPTTAVPPALLPDLAASFPAASREQWLALTQKVLKGGDFNKRLVSRTADGLELQPIYPRPATAAAVTVRSLSEQPWGIACRVDHPDANTANTLLLAELDGGADHVTLAFTGSASARGFGLAQPTVDSLDACLKGVMLDLVHIRLEHGIDAPATARTMAALVARRKQATGNLAINFGLDPIGQLARHGQLPTSWPEVGQQLTSVINELQGSGFNGPFIAIDLRPYHDAGASEAHELGVALASAVTYVRLLATSGMSLAQAFAALSFVVAVDADQLLGIAKLRALRRLMARVQEASGLATTPIRIDTETAWRMMTRRDPWVNMLRTSMATFAAGIGGADSVAVLPYTLPLGLPDGFARRVARNSQVVLLEESNLWRVADPAAGSGAMEAMTTDLAHAGWTQFQQIERDGGMIASLQAGTIQGLVAQVRATRAKDVANRRAPLTGTSEFPNLDEAPVTVLLPAPSSATAPGPLALPSHRLAEPFESLRDAADATAAKTGKRPTVFLANLGPMADHSARSTWIRNLLAAGGIAAATSGDSFTNSAEVGAAFATSDAQVACICGADTTYAELAETTAMTLKNAGCTSVYLAGRPGELEAALTAAGVDAFIVAGQDVVALLAEMQRATQV